MAEMKEEKKEENWHMLITARRTDEGRDKNDETSKELVVLKEKYENLKIVYKESLEKIEKLKNKPSKEKRKAE